MNLVYTDEINRLGNINFSHLTKQFLLYESRRGEWITGISPFILMIKIFLFSSFLFHNFHDDIKVNHDPQQVNNIN